MERFSQRENILLGYSPQRALAYHNYSPKKRSQHSDIDFHDVFGGPLRRSSKQEMSYSFCETMNSSKNSIGVGEGTVSNEMPVFGEETVNRRRYPSDDFFDDIFKGDESLSSPRRSDRDPFGSSSPGSRVSSPACPLPPAQFQFSLPSKLTKATDVPAFASNNHSPYKYKDPTSNAVSSPLPRLSSEAFKEEDQLRNEIHSSNRHSPLSHEYSLSTKEPSYMTKSDKLEPSYTTKSDALESADTGSDMKKDLKSTEAPSNSSQFHFSIYRWASKGVPLLMPHRRGYSPKSKEKVKTERCLSSNGRIESDNMASGLSANESPNTEGRNQDESLCLKTSIEDRVEPLHIALEAVLSMPASKFINIPDIVETVTDDAILSDKREDINPPHSVSDIGLCANTEKQVDMSMHEVQKSELKPLRSLLIEEQGNDEITRKSEAKDRIVKETTVSHSNARVSKNVKKRDEKRIHSNRAEVIQVNEPLSQGAGRTSGDNIGRNGLGGKVKEFIKIFNQEGTSKPKIDTETRRWRGTGTDTCGADNEGSANTTQTNGKKHVHNANKVDKNLAGSEKQQSHTKTTVFCVSDNSFGQKDASKASSESSPDGSKVTVGNIDDLFQENFMIKELSNDKDKPPNIGEDYEDIHISDAKIWQWSNGKEGNIRSLLSTLQFVLWPGSGWKPVPLVDIIEGSAVKRAYQKALLCLHPDKLQQKGVASHQKYIAEKVFDILQEAWDQFNSLSAI